jgi:GH35 family endo-1,4-beta-xylanase
MPPRLRNSLLAALLVMASLGMSGAPAHAAKGMEMALQDDGAFVTELGLKRSTALGLADKLFTSRIRTNIPWSAVVNSPKHKSRPKHRHYDFTSYDALYRKALNHRIKLQVTISGFAPAWATGNHKIGGYKIKVKYFKEFVDKVARHFKHHVDRYSVWNEPNYISWNGPLSSSAKTYRSMYQTAYKEIRKIDPAAKILIGETAPYSQSGRSIAPLKFIRDVVKKGPLKADGYAHHPYDFRHSVTYKYPGGDNVTIATLGRLTSQLSKLAKSHKLATPAGNALPVYLTEYGYMASGHYKVSDSKRAKYVKHAFQVALDNSHVKEMLQYLLVKPPPRSDFFDTSIVSKKHGKVRLSKTFKALQRWAKSEAGKKRIARRTPGR